MQMSTDGLVTRVQNTGDHDKVLQILTAEHGRISVMVKGGKSLKSPAMACSQLFTYGNFELYRKGDFYWLRQGSVLNAFYELSADIVRMSLGVYLCDVANELSDRDEPAEELLRMLLNSLYLIGREKKPQELVKGVFELR
ncbi:MAG: DNA repair protein RecO, partial [Clostridia bacterium]|nr:DNA repair protein RecO [Clostridia bacterium]